MLRALEFDAPTDRVDCGDVPTGGRAALTVECWARVDTIGDGNRPLLSKWSDTGQEWALYVSRDGRLYLVVSDVSGAVAVGYSAAGTVPAGEWRHVAGCFDAVGETVRVLVHGADVTEEGEAFGNVSVDTPQPVQMAGYLVDDQLGLVGALSWGRVSSNVRYPGSSYVVPWAPPAVDGATLAQWNMGEGTGAVLDNAQGNAAYDGAIVGAAWGWGPRVGKRSTTVRSRAQALRARDRRSA